MPYQQGPILLRGTIDNITFYKKEGKWLARKKTSLNKQRVNGDPAFKASRAASKNFGKAARLAKEIYWSLPIGKRGQGVIGKIAGAAHILLKSGLSRQQVKRRLRQQYTGDAKQAG